MEKIHYKRSLVIYSSIWRVYNIKDGYQNIQTRVILSFLIYFASVTKLIQYQMHVHCSNHKLLNSLRQRYNGTFVRPNFNTL